MKNLPHLPHLPRSKLSEKRLSFEICGSLVDLNLPRICRTCRICPRRDRLMVGRRPGQSPFGARHCLTPVECAIDSRTHEQMVASTLVRVKG